MICWGLLKQMANNLLFFTKESLLTFTDPIHPGKLPAGSPQNHLHLKPGKSFERSTSMTLGSKCPIGSMYGIFTYIYHKHQPNVGKYTSPMDPSWVLTFQGVVCAPCPLAHVGPTWIIETVRFCGRRLPLCAA